MPELPDITVYQESLQRLLGDQSIEAITVRSPFVVRTFDPPIDECVGTQVVAIRRIGKRIVWELSGKLFIVFHLMIAGRFHWKSKPVLPTRKVDLAAFRFAHGTLLLTEASGKKRASIHVHSSKQELDQHDRGGLDVLTTTAGEFGKRLKSQNRTLKRALTNPAMFDGIGNSYSDEILHAARLSPLQLTSRLSEKESARLYIAAQQILTEWTHKLREQTGDRFPEKVTAFHPDMAVHGRFGKPCPDCGTKVQRIVFSEREFNYCPGCQTQGRLLKDRSLSRLLKDDWPKTVEAEQE